MSHMTQHQFCRQLLCSVLILLSGFAATGCFNSTTALSVRPHDLRDSTATLSEAKVFTRDGSAYLFAAGFSIHQHALEGRAELYTLSGEKRTLSNVTVDLDSIVAVTCYKKSGNAGTGFGGFLGGVYSPIVPLAIYCIACPKCCFGSCPTIYTPLGNKWALETECFSSSVSKLLENSDLDKLIALPDSNGRFRLRITNEALETHYINQFALIAARHPLGTAMYPTDLGGYIAVRDLLPPLRASNAHGDNILHSIIAKDSDWYRSGGEMVTNFPKTFQSDWIDFEVPTPQPQKKVTLVFRQRNTLLSTILFYDIVLGSQGIDALEWTKRMNADTSYAAKFGTVYKMFSGLTLQVKRKGVWCDQAFFGDSGPLTWKEIATTVTSNAGDTTLKCRLKFFPDNVVVDQIAYSLEVEREQFITGKVVLDSAVEHPEVGGYLSQADSLYLETNPGDNYTLYYHLPQITPTEETTLFIRSQGYYTEWLRGSWIRKHEANTDSFNLNDVPKTLRMLATSWEEDEAEIERMFFQTRIPIRGTR